MQVPRKGCLLIANPSMQDPNFSRTVVLLCEHDERGSMGLVLNRPTQYSLADALSGLPERVPQEARLFWGGPVQTKMVLALFRDSVDSPGGRQVTGDMTLGADLDRLLERLEETRPEESLRVFAGYAGWDSGQLDREMTEKSWIVGSAEPQLVFETAPDQVWTAALKTLGPHFAFLATMPADPRMN